MTNAIEYFTPCSKSFPNIKSDFKNLNNKNKIFIIFLTAFAALVSCFACCILGFATFRKLVEVLKTRSLQIPILSHQQLHLPIIQQNQSFIPFRIIPSQQKPADLAAMLQVQSVQNKQHIIKIQKVFRGFVTRKKENIKKSLLHYKIFEKAKPFIDNSLLIDSLPEASEGNTRVYLPKGIPIVLKQSGAPENQHRFEQMQIARAILVQNNYRLLVIPQARVYAHFIIESRIPIRVSGLKQQIGLYIENRDKFSNAVKEFTGFRCQIFLYDIVGGKNPYASISKAPIGRYDNAALYLEHGQGKIGLIDLEHSKVQINKPKDWYLSCCKDAIHLFPYHFEEIMIIAKAFDTDSTLEEHRKELEACRDNALNFFKIIYEEHLTFIKWKGISFQNAAVFKQNETKLHQIKESMLREMTAPKDKDDKSLLFIDPLEIELIKQFEEIIPEILNEICLFISEFIEMQVKSMSEPISSNIQLLECRTLIFATNSKIYKELQAKISKLLEKIKEEEFSAHHLITMAFKELAKGKVIAYFNDNLGSPNRYCIFC